MIYINSFLTGCVNSLLRYPEVLMEALQFQDGPTGQGSGIYTLSLIFFSILFMCICHIFFNDKHCF